VEEALIGHTDWDFSCFSLVGAHMQYHHHHHHHGICPYEYVAPLAAKVSGEVYYSLSDSFENPCLSKVWAALFCRQVRSHSCSCTRLLYMGTDKTKASKSLVSVVQASNCHLRNLTRWYTIIFYIHMCLSVLSDHQMPPTYMYLVQILLSVPVLSA